MDKTQTLLKNTYICLLAGGAGTRLWPSSRQQTPKQFSSLFAKHTLFQQTIKRVKGLIPLSRIIVITNKDYVDDILQQEPLLPEENIIAEPEKKNTALAMGVASAWIYKRNPNAIMINLATDHLIENVELYRKTLVVAAQAATEQNKLVSVGIVPTFAHTGLGYIESDQEITKINGISIMKMVGFKEKPDEVTAKRFINTGRYFWNANNYVWPVKLALDEFKLYAPDLYQNIMTIYESIGTSKQQETLKEQYHQAREAQIDTAISEKTKRMIVVPGEFGWSDVGDWQVVYDLSPHDTNKNVLMSHGKEGQVISIDSHNNLVHGHDQLIVTVGVEDLVIVDTKDALLVCRKDRSQDVKKVVELLKEKKLKRYL